MRNVVIVNCCCMMILGLTACDDSAAYPTQNTIISDFHIKHGIDCDLLTVGAPLSSTDNKKPSTDEFIYIEFSYQCEIKPSDGFVDPYVAHSFVYKKERSFWGKSQWVYYGEVDTYKNLGDYDKSMKAYLEYLERHKN